MSKHLPHIVARAYNTPTLLEPSYAQFFYAYLGQRAGMTRMVNYAGQELDAQGMKELAGAYRPRSSRVAIEGDDASRFYAVQGGIALIDVGGTLVHKNGYIGSDSGMQGYDGIAAQIDSANANPNVRGILLDIDSPGGEVAGCKALADKIKASVKPVWAVANETAASAAYWIASAAKKLIVTPTGAVGSIGVLTAHTDYSEQLSNEGIKVTLIFAGAHKVDGNPYEALSASVQADVQADIDALRTEFAQAVATNRGKTLGAVLSTEARMYRAQAAVDIKLADAVMSFDEALAAMQSQFINPARSGNKGAFSMSQEQAPTGDLTQAQTEPTAAAVQAARAEGASAERARIAAILNHPEAKGREDQARVIALTPNLGVDTAGALLASSPKQTQAIQGLAQGAGVPAEVKDQTEPKHRIDAGIENMLKGAK